MSPGSTHKNHPAPRTIYRSDYPAPLNHPTATAQIVPRAESTNKNVQKDAHFCRICLFLVTSSTVRSRMSPDVARQHAHKARVSRTTYLSDYPAPLDHSTATARTVPRAQRTNKNVQKDAHFGSFLSLLRHNLALSVCSFAASWLCV